MKSIAIAVVAVVCFVVTGARPVSAGSRSTPITFISSDPDGSGTASGALGAARNSASTTEYIGCTLWAQPGGTSTICQAEDAAGTSRYCYSAAQNFIDVVTAFTPDGYLVFSWDAQGQCTYLAMYNYSVWEPKLP
jgi:hypothetical protein